MEFQAKAGLLSHLGWKPNVPPPEYAMALASWWFGTRNGKSIPGKAPIGVPLRRIAEFIIFYSPSRLVSDETKFKLAREYNFSLVNRPI